MNCKYFIKNLVIASAVIAGAISLPQQLYGQHNNAHQNSRQQDANPARSSLKREFRGAWFATVVNKTWRNMTTDSIKADICNILDSMAAVNTNAVIFQVRPQADALFVSEFEPWSRFITGEQGCEPTPFFDPAAFTIEECHKRGMEFHAWFNPYRVTSNEEETLAPNHLYFKNPGIFVKYGKQLYFNPGEPESRNHTLKVIADFVKRYDTDAVHFDDYFYPYKVDNLEFPDDSAFIRYGEADGFKPPHNGVRAGENDSLWMAVKADWRRNNVSMLVKALNDTIKAEKPWVKFGISPFGIWRELKNDPRGSQHPAGVCTNYDELYADILLWCQEGWIDYNVPQLYWPIGHKAADYKGLAIWWSKNKGKAQLYVGQSISATLDAKLPDGTRQDQLYDKIKLERELGNYDGNIWWSGHQMVKDQRMMDSLRTSYQKFPALHPLYPNIDSIAPQPVNNLKVAYIYDESPLPHNNFVVKSTKSYSHKNDNRANVHNTHAMAVLLKWDAPKADTPMDEAVWYAIYLFEKGEDIDLDRSERLLKIVRETTFEMPEVHAGETIVVTAIDRMWNESSATEHYIQRRGLK